MLVTVGPGLRLLDRRRVDLTHGLPTHPHHHEGSWAVGRYLDSAWARPTTLPEALALVGRVREAAAVGAREALEALATTVSEPIATITLRVCPPLPPTPEACIRDNRAQTYADSVLYREALAAAADARGWAVRWYDRDDVQAEAAAALAGADLAELLAALGRKAGPPWQAAHKLAATAAIATLRPRPGG